MIVPQIVVVHLVSRSLPAFGVVSRVPPFNPLSLFRKGDSSFAQVFLHNQVKIRRDIIIPVLIKKTNSNGLKVTQSQFVSDRENGSHDCLAKTMVCLQSPTNLSVIKKVSTLSKCTRVVVLLEGKLCKQRNSSFCLTCDQAFFFRGKSFSPRLRNKREERSPDRRLRFVLIFSHPAEELRGCYW